MPPARKRGASRTLGDRRLDETEQKFCAIWGQLVRGSERIVLALSGGGDSMALLTLAHAVNHFPEFRLELVPAHVDHRLREESSCEAEALRTYIEATFSLPLSLLAVTVTDQARWGVEMAARNSRHQALEALRQSVGARTIALGHQFDDQVETVLIRLLRGTGVSGLAAMVPASGHLIRPLLGFGREELRQYLQRKQISWMEDPSNQDRRYFRNQVRLDILPYLRRVANPRIDRVLYDLSTQTRPWQEMVARAADAFLGEYGVALTDDPLIWPRAFAELDEPVKAELLQRKAKIHGLRLQTKHLSPIWAGKAVTWPSGWQITWTDGGEMRVTSPKPEELPTCSLIPFRPGLVRWPPGGALMVETVGTATDEGPGYRAYVHKAQDEIWSFRTWLPGDRLRPVGLAGSKKLQDMFVDRKVPKDARHRWPVLVNQADEVMSVIGLANDECSQQEGMAWLIRYWPKR